MIDPRDTRTAARWRSDESIVPPASGNWDFGFVEVKTGKEPAWLISAAACAGLFMSSYAASASLLIDVPTPRESETVESVYRPIAHRRISIAGALHLSNQIMERAESGRRRAADEEAARAFDLELDG